MKLLIYSHAFAPQVGGIETFVMNLARSFAQPHPGRATEDFCVTVVTQTPNLAGDVSNRHPFEIVRKPSSWKLWRLIGNADSVLLAGPAILPLAFALLRRRILI